MSRSSPPFEPLSRRLRRLRVERELSVSQIAAKIGVSESTYREWEYGRAILGEPYEKLAEAFSVPLTQLLLGRDSEFAIVEHLTEIERRLKAVKSLL